MHKISVAPMLDVTYSHFRFFMRLLTKKTTFWSEMIHENAIMKSKYLNLTKINKGWVLKLYLNTIKQKNQQFYNLEAMTLITYQDVAKLQKTWDTTR